MPGESTISPSTIIESLTERFANSNLHLSIRKGEAYFNSGEERPGDERLPDIGCIQTMFEGLATYHLSTQGLIDPSAPLSDYLSEFASKGHVGREIKVAHLMSHSTGFHAPPSFFQGDGFKSWDDLTEFFSATKASFPPGSVASLNSLSRNLLHGLIYRITGKDIFELVREYIFLPNNLKARYVNTEGGWPMLLFPVAELAMIPNLRLGDVALGNSFVRILEGATFNVVRGVRAPRASTPVGYAWGVALFSDGLWGLNSNMVPNTAGFRFGEKENFAIALAMNGNHLVRDLVLQYITTSLRRTAKGLNPGLMGSVVDCRVDELDGIYTADTGDVVAVETSGGSINISIKKESSVLVDLQVAVNEDGQLFGSGRWDTLQIEFFRHPEQERPSLLIGQIAYMMAHE